MSAEFVFLVIDLFIATGQATGQGQAIITPPDVLIPDPGDEMTFTPQPVVVPLGDGSRPQVQLVSTDSVGPQPNGWTYTISFAGIPGNPPGFSFTLPHANGATQYLSQLAQVPSVTPTAQYAPLPATSPASASQVLGLSSDSPLTTQWVTPSGGTGAVSSVFGREGVVAAEAGDYAVAQVTGAASTSSVTSAVAAEATRAETAEATLTTAVSGRVARSGDTMTGPLSPAVYVITTTSGTITWDVAAGQAQGANVYNLTLTGNATISAPTGGTDGQVIRLRIVTGGFTVTWGAGWDWGAAGAPALSTTAGARDRIVAECVTSLGTTEPAWDAAADLGH